MTADHQRLLPFALVMIITFVGCLDAVAPEAARLPASRANSNLVFVRDIAQRAGCDPLRPAFPHLFEGKAAPDGSTVPPTPCLVRTGFASVEPTLGVSKNGTVFLYPASKGQTATLAGPIGVARSWDQGARWELRLPTLGPVTTHPYTLDPYMYLDPTTDRIFAEDLITSHCASLSYSDDLGGTWTNTMAGCTQADHVTIFAGPPVTSPTLGYPNIVYRCAFNTVATLVAGFSSTCQKSLDGGRIWIQTGTPPYHADPTQTGHFEVPGYCTGDLGHGVVDHQGWVYLPKGWCRQPWLAISKDEGLTWVRVQVSDLGMPTAGFHHDEASVGVDSAGTIYYAWIARDRLPYLTISADRGVSWSVPRPIGAPEVVEAALGELVVGGSGKLAFAYYGSTNSPGPPYSATTARDCLSSPQRCLQASPAYAPNVTWNGYITMTANALDAEPLFFSASVNSPDDPLMRGSCGPLTCGPAADFIDIRVDSHGTPWASFIDGCTGVCVTDGHQSNNAAEGVLGNLFGGPPLLPTERTS